ncbi:MAG: SDR family oxidoreductase, partial [Steroidobacteraceae bacterium]
DIVDEFADRAVAVALDVTDTAQIAAAVAAADEAFGGIDVLVNNASAISLTGTAATDMKRYDLMNGINTRGTYLAGRLCLPHLERSANPHILTMSPPLDLRSKWFAPHVAYSIAKYGMSLCTLGWAEEFRALGIAANSLWPRTTIATAAANMFGGEAAAKLARTPQIMADAAHIVLTKPARECTGNFFVDETLLHAHGITDFSKYAAVPGTPDAALASDLFLPAEFDR